MITIEVRFHSDTKQFSPTGEDTVSLNFGEGLTLVELFEYLNIPPNYPRIAFVDEELVPANAIIRGGAFVRIFPHISGG